VNRFRVSRFIFHNIMRVLYAILTSSYYYLRPYSAVKHLLLHYDQGFGFDLCKDLTNMSEDDLKRYCQTLYSKETFRNIAFGWRHYPSIMMQADILYLLVRHMRPDNVVEVGVGAGASSVMVLEALSDNEHGHLYSVDLWDANIPNKGILVPSRLRKRWNLIIGSAEECLQGLLDKLGQIDIFIHDGGHTYESMTFQFETAWSHIKRRGILLSHDIYSNSAFFDFLKKRNLSPSVYGGLGGIKKR